MTCTSHHSIVLNGTRCVTVVTIIPRVWFMLVFSFLVLFPATHVLFRSPAYSPLLPLCSALLTQISTRSRAVLGAKMTRLSTQLVGSESLDLPWVLYSLILFVHTNLVVLYHHDILIYLRSKCLALTYGQVLNIWMDLCIVRV